MAIGAAIASKIRITQTRTYFMMQVLNYLVTISGNSDTHFYPLNSYSMLHSDHLN